jgi:LysR family cys regulon transcriptional activator
MNFQQLRIIRETARRNFNLTEVANALYTSQSGVSKHIKDLEEELGVELFVRRGKRLLGMTDPGKELVPIVERILLDLNNVRHLADHYARRDEGSLRLATTHTQARYALPPVVAAFRKEFPRVHLVLHQASPSEIVAMLRAGDADIGVATEALDACEELETFPFYTWHHAVLVPKGHPLTTLPKLTLAALAEHPLITYHHGFTGRGRVDAAFSAAGLVPDVVMSALDTDVIKAYVELELGVGIVAPTAFDAVRDSRLALLDASHLFEKNTTLVAIRRGHLLRGFAQQFIRRCCPDVDAVRLGEAMSANGGRALED